MKTIKILYLLTTMVFCINLYGQNHSLKVEFIKTDNEYLKVLNDGKKSCSFFIEGIKSQKQAENLENYIRGYRGVEQFNIIKNTDGKYKAEGIFYSFANAQYFKYLFQLINVEKVYINNQWINVEQFNNL
jgi:hypothetical protein